MEIIPSELELYKAIKPSLVGVISRSKGELGHVLPTEESSRQDNLFIFLVFNHIGIPIKEPWGIRHFICHRAPPCRSFPRIIRSINIVVAKNVAIHIERYPKKILKRVCHPINYKMGAMRMSSSPLPSM
jgi:hypothetical protein